MQLASRPYRGTPLLRLLHRLLRFLALDAKGGERAYESYELGGARESFYSFEILLCVLLYHASRLLLCIALV